MQQTQDAAAAIAWFTEFQLHSVIRNGIVPEWFHGVISRKAAEEILHPKPPGYFLVRVSETRIGYTLSYRADDRCRHFIIEVLRDGQYVILGEDTRHPSLQDLVDFHRRVPIVPFNEVLTVACGQVSEDKADYAELLFRKRAPAQPNQTTLPINPPSPRNQARPRTPEETPPALPLRSIATKEQPPSGAPAVPTGGTPRLYPLLDTELLLSTLQPPTLVEPSMKPVALPRKIHCVTPTSIPAGQPPKLPARSCLAQWDPSQAPCLAPCLAPNRSPRTPPAISLPPASVPTSHTDPNQTQPGRGQEGKSAVISNIKRKFQKKRASSQDHMYSEICVEAEERPGPGPGLGLGRPGAPGAGDRVENKALENEYQELGGLHCGAPPSNSTVALSSRGGGLPPEYLHPPPFAPGY